METKTTITHIEIPAPDLKRQQNFIQKYLAGSLKRLKVPVIPFSESVIPVPAEVLMLH